jgi:23S rRNA (adenine2030-N6)-methyltransferase
MVIVNPPYTLEAELAVLMPVLTRLLSDGSGARWSVETIGTERA